MALTEGQPGEEHRQTRRIPFEEEVTLLSPAKAKGRAVDIGAGGIGVELPVELVQETPVELEILSGHAITQGTVRWTAPAGDGFRTGIQFRSEDWNIIELILALRNQED
jgi:hypothetical protein